MEIKELGIQVPDETYNLDQARLVEEAIINKEFSLANTGKYTGYISSNTFISRTKELSKTINTLGGPAKTYFLQKYHATQIL